VGDTKGKRRFVVDAMASGAAVRAPRREHGNPLGPLGRQFAMLTCALLNADTVDDVVRQVVGSTVALVPEADLVSVTLRSQDGRHRTVAESGPVATELDELQYQPGEGLRRGVDGPDTGPRPAGAPAAR
jgi:hypothetical protein